MLPRYTLEQLAEIVEQLRAITVAQHAIFTVSLVNAHNDQAFDVGQIRQSGMVYIQIDHAGYLGNLPVWVVVVEEEAQA